MSDFAKFLKERDDKYRALKGMIPLGEADPLVHLQVTVMESAKPEQVIDNGLECRKCHKNTVVSYQVQFRSGDEGTNTLLKCTNPSCGNTILRH